MTKTTEKVNLNVWIPRTLKTSLQKLAEKQLGGNLSQLVLLICQDFLDNKRQIIISSKQEMKK